MKIAQKKPVADKVEDAPIVEDQQNVRPPMMRCADDVSMLLHPYTQQVFTQAPTDADVDGWVQAQLDAGKLVQC